MIHIITLHYHTPAWIPIQNAYFEKYSEFPDQYKIYLMTRGLPLYNVPPNTTQIPMDNVDVINEHYVYLNYAYKEVVSAKAAPEDIIVFIDGDAFPCDAWMKKVLSYFESNDIVAIYRDEDNAGLPISPFPHMSFFAITKNVWDTYNFLWDSQYAFPKEFLDDFQQRPGSFREKLKNLTYNEMKQALVLQPGYPFNNIIESNNLKVKKLYRSNIFNKHEVMFGVYDDIIYHQSCGNRGIVGRPDNTLRGKSNAKRQCYEGLDLNLRKAIGDWTTQECEEVLADIFEVNTAVFDSIFLAIQKDKSCTFIKRCFLGKP